MREKHNDRSVKINKYLSSLDIKKVISEEVFEKFVLKVEDLRDMEEEGTSLGTISEGLGDV